MQFELIDAGWDMCGGLSLRLVLQSAAGAARHSFAFTQLFSVPVTLIEGKAYVGGQGIDRGDARFVDFLFSGASASDAILSFPPPGLSPTTA
jgi:hypothetical protein